jgi:hypothetical protein
LWHTGPYEIRSIDLRSGASTTNQVKIHARFKEGHQVVMLNLSPDDRFLAYVSNETESYEVYVTPFPSCDRRWHVNSSGQSYWPVWRKVREQLFLYFTDHDGATFEVPVSEDGNALTMGQPRLLFQRRTEGLRSGDWPPGFDAYPDSQEFLVFELPDDTPRETYLTMVQNLGEVLAQKK